MSEKRSIDWRRSVVAVVVGEFVPILALVMIVLIWGPTDGSEAEQFARRLGMWVGPIGGAATICLMAAWAGARAGRPVVQGALIGFTLATADVAILAATGEPFAWVFVASNVGRIAAGAVGGWIGSSRQ